MTSMPELDRALARKWTPEQRKKFSATVAAKKSGKKTAKPKVAKRAGPRKIIKVVKPKPRTTSIPIAHLPDRPAPKPVAKKPQASRERMVLDAIAALLKLL